MVPVYILDDAGPGKWRIGAAQRWWLHHSLEALRNSLEERGSRLILRRGRAAEELRRLADELGTRRVHATVHYEPWWRAAEEQVAAQLDLQLHDGDVLAPPEKVKAGSGGPYRIYTPYWRALQDRLPPAPPVPGPDLIEGPKRWPAGDELDSLDLLPSRPNWAVAFADEWTPGESAAAAQLDRFAQQVGQYAATRDLPGQSGTSGSSPHLHFGELSPRQVWHSLSEASGEKFRKELAWRDFARNVMLNQPSIGEKAGRAEFELFPWRTGPEADDDFRSWCRGETGYPIVDAGMRQLWSTGWMHNRVRMIAASFLVKHLLIDWRRGAEWFWDTLVDADYGNNSQNWQWVAGTGIDSQPFNRIMSPTLQSEKFGAADYIRRWVPELRPLSDQSIHAPPEDLFSTYPLPIIDHRAARARALEALRAFGAAY